MKGSLKRQAVRNEFRAKVTWRKDFPFRSMNRERKDIGIVARAQFLGKGGHLQYAHVIMAGFGNLGQVDTEFLVKMFQRTVEH